MTLLAAVAALVVLVILDLRGVINLGHPVLVLLSAVAWLFVTVWSTLQLLLGALRFLGDALPIGSLLSAGLALLLGNLLGLYVLLKANLRPMGRKRESPGRTAARLLDCGLILGIPLQALLIGGYIAVAVGLGQVIEGPWWMLPFYPLVLMVLWPMMHLVFHVAIVAVAIDPFLILAGLLIGILWTLQEIFLLHGTVRGCMAVRKGPGSVILRVLLSLVPVVNLVSAISLRLALRREAVRACEEVLI